MKKPAAVPRRADTHQLRIVPGYFTKARVGALQGAKPAPLGYVRTMPWLFALLLLPMAQKADAGPARGGVEQARLALTTAAEDCTQHRLRAFFASSDGVMPLCWDLHGDLVRIWFGDSLIVSAPASAFIDTTTPAPAGQGASQ